MGTTHVIAVDLGAESGRVMRVGFDGASLTWEDVHRFPNIPVEVRGTLCWDVLSLWQAIKTGLEMAGEAASVGVDTWGVDFALLDRDGSLLANPVHYRDRRTDGLMDWVFERVPRRAVFERTGIQFMPINTLYQLASLIKARSPVLGAAATLLTIPTLFTYWLGGERVCEFTHATTTQFYNPRRGDWDLETLGALEVPLDILTPIAQPGTPVGDYHGLPVILPATHDTGSAVVAVPAQTTDFAYISSGTWSLVGLEVTSPVITDQSYAANVTNEGGVGGTFRLLKNVMGLWLAQQCRATWQAEGRDYDYPELAAAAAAEPPFRSLVDPDDSTFLPPGDMPRRLRDFCQRTGQPVPETVGQFMRAVYESLALKYRFALDKLIAISGRAVNRLHIIGGGARNRLLCQMTADATGRPVIAGPFEATALGNGIVQLIALGHIADVAQAREILSRTTELAHYEPQDTAAWDEAYGRFGELVTSS